MIRWSFVLSRLITIAVILMLLRWGLGPTAGYVTIQAIEAMTGAKVDISATRVGLFPPRLQYIDLRVADPREGRQYKDIFRADRLDLVIDGDALMHRRFVISDGVINGIVVGSQRGVSGHYEPVQPVQEDDGPSFLEGLVRGTADELEADAAKFVDELETLKRGRAIKQRWESDYQTLLTRAKGLEVQIREIRDKTRTLANDEPIYNKLRDQSQLPALLQQAMQVRRDLIEVRAAIDAIPDRFKADLVAIDQAKQIDFQRVDDFVPGNLAESKNFGADLIANSVRSQIQKVRDYLDTSRTVAGYTVLAPQTERFGGLYFDMHGDDRPPQSLIRRCEVNGMMRVDGQTYQLTGVLENLTPTPERLDHPSRAKLLLEGPEVVKVEFIRDQRRGNDIDLITLHWPATTPPPMQIGKTGEAKLTIQGGSRELWVQLRNDRGQLDGRLVSKQLGTQIGLDVDGDLGESAAVRALRDHLDSVDRIEVDARFTGTWKHLDFDVHSNLKQIVAQATRQAIDAQLLAGRELIQTKIAQVHADQTAELQQWLAKHEGKADELLKSADDSIQEITQRVSGEADRYADRLRQAFQNKIR